MEEQAAIVDSEVSNAELMPLEVIDLPADEEVGICQVEMACAYTCTHPIMCPNIVG